MLTPGAYDPRFMKPATLCRCGHILECCADDLAWLVENSPRISNEWRGRLVLWSNPALNRLWQNTAAARHADTAEAHALSVYESQR